MKFFFIGQLVQNDIQTASTQPERKLANALLVRAVLMPIAEEYRGHLPTVYFAGAGGEGEFLLTTCAAAIT